MQLQVKIIIGTIAFMLTMIVLGFVTIREPARLEAFSNAYDGRRIERGADVFANNCTSCHGVNGKAEECYNTAGELQGCAGRALNHPDLLCGVPSPRMSDLGWTGTKLGLVESTITSGRPWNGMPTWGEDFGGPLQNNQVENVAMFVANWESDALCGNIVVEEPVEWPTSVAELPAGDAANGEELYNIEYACSACHGDPADASTASVGPSLSDIANTGATRQDDYTAADYLYESALHPGNFIAPECPNGPCGEPSAMPNTFGERMSLQDMADVLSFLLGTDTFESSAEVVYP